MKKSAYLNSAPETIRIGPWDINLRIEKGPFFIQNEACVGFYSPRTMEIGASHDVANQKVFVGIVIHELIHALIGIYNIPVEKDKEEDVVMHFETAFTDLLRNNPELITWLQKGLK